MSAKYLIRFDDICPSMNWQVWEQVENILTQYRVRPLLAVVPDNRDLTLIWGPARVDFWARVRRWQSQGWTIAIHGHQHLFSTADSGLLGRNPYSEFAGVAEQIQTEKLDRAFAVFEENGVRPEVWIAPAHSFDATTLKILRHHGIRVVSDGDFLYPKSDDDGMFWIPQQISDFRPRLLGVWTVCYHPNWWQERDIQRFRKSVSKFQHRITSVSSVAKLYQRNDRGWANSQYARYVQRRTRLLRFLRTLKQRSI